MAENRRSGFDDSKQIKKLLFYSFIGTIHSYKDGGKIYEIN